MVEETCCCSSLWMMEGEWERGRELEVIKDLRRHDHIFKRPRPHRGWSEIRFGKRDETWRVCEENVWCLIEKLLIGHCDESCECSWEYPRAELVHYYSWNKQNTGGCFAFTPRIHAVKIWQKTQTSLFLQTGHLLPTFSFLPSLCFNVQLLHA